MVYMSAIDSDLWIFIAVDLYMIWSKIVTVSICKNFLQNSHFNLYLISVKKEKYLVGIFKACFFIKKSGNHKVININFSSLKSTCFDKYASIYLPTFFAVGGKNWISFSLKVKWWIIYISSVFWMH